MQPFAKVPYRSGKGFFKYLSEKITKDLCSYHFISSTFPEVEKPLGDNKVFLIFFYSLTINFPDRLYFSLKYQNTDSPFIE